MPKPLSLPADGMLRVLLVPTIADPSAPTVAELTAVGVVDITCYLTADGYNPSVEEGTIEDARLCDRETYSQPGRVTHSLEATYVFNPSSTPDNKAYAALVPKSNWYVVERWGIAYETAIAAAQKVCVRPSVAGARRRQSPAVGTVLRITQQLAPTDTYREDVAVAA